MYLDSDERKRFGGKSTICVDYVYLDSDERKRFYELNNEFLLSALTENILFTVPNSNVLVTNILPSLITPIPKPLFCISFVTIIINIIKQINIYNIYDLLFV
jgi:hypothetical protein